MEEIYAAYSKMVKKNISLLEELLREDAEIVGQDTAREMEKVLETSSKHVSSKWGRGGKHIRTYFAKKAIPNYPRSVMQKSLAIDATINILDDLLDTCPDAETKQLYILELVRNIANYYLGRFDEETRQAVFRYFHKVILIAFTEAKYTKSLQEEVDLNEIIRQCFEIYRFKSFDFDIFIELPLLERCFYRKNIKEVLEYARLFRSITLAKKDLLDAEKDREEGISTAVTILVEKSVDLRHFFDRLSTRYPTTDYNGRKEEDERQGRIIENLLSMAEQEKKEVGRILAGFGAAKRK